MSLSLAFNFDTTWLAFGVTRAATLASLSRNDVLQIMSSDVIGCRLAQAVVERSVFTIASVPAQFGSFWTTVVPNTSIDCALRPYSPFNDSLSATLVGGLLLMKLGQSATRPVSVVSDDKQRHSPLVAGCPLRGKPKALYKSCCAARSPRGLGNRRSR